ncbi:DNA topoisomerase 3 [Paenibacillus alvei]|uniref:DNA topoisomerase n=1 Tax=Paenibacillus alvei TaxID=44250 RepID=A0ABT4GZU3_PAEAL|nr:DNA topoisomerase 3 [Paenibacillus alvei]EJW15729.1 DNA topoisomerase 3 [Paenibacillus alvei DSM 29]MCY7486677.1 DNA topoisomerase 3 [Paenibacillus alvei]MCY9542969.1 DNA topoisomerase 3 [Paenibacillus alvei]MCY9706295.1 DNA topoisomerase 3 [Paenibacillus alvei]MCY9734264.1 DNA topoisomerase 3 [Paenibacillus alvei]
MKTLVVAEKPDMGRNIASVIEPRGRKHRTHIEGERYIITWAIGHLLRLAEPEVYDAKYKRWNFNDLPILPSAFKIVAERRTKDQLKIIGELAKQCSTVVNACDAGREGQYIFALIQQHYKWKQPVKRLWISDLTAETIRRGFEELKGAEHYERLTAAARARSEADWIIGMNASRAFTTKHKALLSVGRVQTPVLALIYDREQEIAAFQAESYFDITAVFQQGDVIYKGIRQGDRIVDEQLATSIADKVRGREGRIAEYNVKEGKEYPYKLYDLTLLQRDANARYGYSAKKTLDIAQALYEKHKAITYPRTNSNYVTEQNIAGMHQALNMLRNMQEYAALTGQADPKRVHRNNRGVCNPDKVEDHHAILPTTKRPGTLSSEEGKIYDLIVRRMLAHFYPVAEYTLYTVLTEVEQIVFKTSMKQWRVRGWKNLYDGLKEKSSARTTKRSKQKDEDDGDEKSSSTEEIVELGEEDAFHLIKEQPVDCKEAEIAPKSTQPPKSYTEGTLLKAMESAGKQLDNEELRDAMKDAGLGTPATRAATIERLKQVGYIGMTGKRLTLTTKGKTAVELIRGAGVNLLTSPEMTGQWERRLTQIARGEASEDVFMEAVRKFTLHVIDCVEKQKPVSADVLALIEIDKKPGSKGTGKRAGNRKSNGTSAYTDKNGTSDDARSHAAMSSKTVSTISDRGRQARTSSSPQPPETFGLCPREGCGGTIIEGRKGYGCSNYKQGCKFVVWKKQLAIGKTISAVMMRDLLEKGTTKRLNFTKGNATVKGRLGFANRSSGDLKIYED